jgi:hypothetical protein
MLNFYTEAKATVAKAIANGWAAYPPVIGSDAYVAARRSKARECMRRLFEKRRSMGLTCEGTPYKRKPSSTKTESEKADHAAYMRAYRANRNQKP